MLKQLSIKVGEDFLEEIDECVAGDPLVDTRTEWVKHALREKIIQRKKEELDKHATKKSRELMARGVKPGFLSKKEKKELFNELAREYGLKKTRRGS